MISLDLFYLLFLHFCYSRVPDHESILSQHRYPTDIKIESKELTNNNVVSPTSDHYPQNTHNDTGSGGGGESETNQHRFYQEDSQSESNNDNRDDGNSDDQHSTTGDQQWARSPSHSPILSRENMSWSEHMKTRIELGHEFTQ